MNVTTDHQNYICFGAADSTNTKWNYKLSAKLNVVTAVCGNGVKESGEACDDGKNCSFGGTACPLGGGACGPICATQGGDGCSADCMTIEPGWACPTAGAPCVCANLTKKFTTEDAINYLDLINSGLTPTSDELVYFDTNCDHVLDSSDGINIYDSQT